MVATSESTNYNYNEQDQGYDVEGDDDRKVFLTRIPTTFDETSIQHIFEKYFGVDCVEYVSLVRNRDEEKDNEKESGKANTPNNDKKKHVSNETSKSNNEEAEHRGFAFVTMKTIEKQKEAIAKENVRGKAREGKKRKHTMYIRPISRSNSSYDNSNFDDCHVVETKSEQDDSQQLQGSGSNVCYLWNKFRCPYGDQCKFEHIGDGGCITSTEADAKKKKKQKCHSFRTKGKCALGEKCPYSHDFICKKVHAYIIDSESNKDSSTSMTTPKDKKDKDCINWKTKGKCRKGDKCPYKHDEAILQALILKKENKEKRALEEKKKKNKNDKTPQPLGVRVFGLNYDTTEKDVREYFEHCGKIREITFPTFEDSGRSKGYCGILFTSPYATEKACELDGHDLHGRWLSVQPGKMYLRKWEDMEQSRKHQRDGGMSGEGNEGHTVGEFGQRVKKRKTHGFKDD